MYQTNSHSRADLLTAAAHAVSEYGVDVPVGRIAKTAGVTEAALLNDYPSRELLLNALYVQIHCDPCSKLRAYVVPSEPLRERARAIWNAYIDWGLANPDWRCARHRLMVSDLLTEKTRKVEALHFPDIEVAEAASQSEVFDEHSPEFGESIFIALAEATIALCVRDPACAEAHKLSGFHAHWRVFFA